MPIITGGNYHVVEATAFIWKSRGVLRRLISEVPPHQILYVKILCDEFQNIANKSNYWRPYIALITNMEKVELRCQALRSWQQIQQQY